MYLRIINHFYYRVELVARPSKYDPKFNKQVYKLSLLGATDKEIADFLEIAESTLNLWKTEHDEFMESLKKGKMIADSKVVQALFKRACGYSHKEDKIFMHEGSPVIVPTIKHYPPDSVACFYWLNNRQRDRWSNKTDVESPADYVPPVPRKVEYEKVHPSS